MATFEKDLGSEAGFKRFDPAADAEAPEIAVFQAWEIELRAWGAEVVACGFGKFQKRRADFCAYGMEAVIAGAGMAKAVTKISGHWIGAAGFKGSAQDVGGHGF